MLANIGEAIGCAILGAVGGSWTVAILGGRGSHNWDLIGIGGGITALVGMIGGAVVGAVAGAVYTPYLGWDATLALGETLIVDVMKGLPGYQS
ncbi:colicin V synthesis protein [Candidatus Pantoea deserta]|uniref:Colicin V synthesis protein n=2 Tax=Candidatus Pantoea deserta TaxID=1869313 RepID=A0A3N4NML7_9GAMM|nr:colicin V synthesis protein [Pantoea deserta]